MIQYTKKKKEKTLKKATAQKKYIWTYNEHKGTSGGVTVSKLD